MRTLWIDARQGPLSAATLLGALVDLGAAPSPILRAVASLELPVEMRFEGARVAFVPEHHGILLQARQAAGLFDASGIDEGAQKLAADALGRLLLAEEGLRGAFSANVDASVVLALAGAAVALAQLDAQRYVLGPALASTPDGDALLKSLGAESGAEPAWRGPVARGACDGTLVALSRA